MKPSRKHSSCVKRDTENVDRDTQTPGSQPEDDGLEAMRIGPDVRPFDLADRKVLGVQGREMGAVKPHALALMHVKTSVNNGDSKATHIGIFHHSKSHGQSTMNPAAKCNVEAPQAGGFAIPNGIAEEGQCFQRMECPYSGEFGRSGPWSIMGAVKPRSESHEQTTKDLAVSQRRGTSLRRV